MCYERDAEEEKSMSKNIKRQRLFWSRVSKTERFMRNKCLFCTVNDSTVVELQHPRLFFVWKITVFLSKIIFVNVNIFILIYFVYNNSKVIFEGGIDYAD